MADKKKEKQETKKTTKKVVVPPKPKVKTLVKEDIYPASEIAKTLGVSDFAFLIIKQEAGISDGSFLTISEFQELHKKIIGR